MIPSVTLQTDRLTLRPPAESDFEACHRFMTSPRAAFIGGPSQDRWQNWRGFLSGMGHWALRGYGFFSVLRDDLMVGRVGVVYHEAWPEPELGWHLFEGQEGKGYATEAARAVRGWAFQERGLGPLISMIAPDNARSRATALRLGATFESESTLLGNPCEVYRHPAGAAP